MLTIYRRYYRSPCYYLDNLVVDFRYGRRGIGSVLVEWGISKAAGLGLNCQTEAGPMSQPLYSKLGFTKVGDWTVELSEGERLVMPVMKYPSTIA